MRADEFGSYLEEWWHLWTGSPDWPEHNHGARRHLCTVCMKRPATEVIHEPRLELDRDGRPLKARPKADDEPYVATLAYDREVCEECRHALCD